MKPFRGIVGTRAAAVIVSLVAAQTLMACSASRNPTASARAAAAPAPAAASAPAAPPPAAATQEVSGGLLPSVAGAPILAGVDLGIYQRNGLDVSLQTFTSTPQIMTAVAAGQLDFGQVTMGAAAFNAYNRGVDIVIVAAGSLGTVPVIVRKNLWDSGAVRSVQDLKDR